MGIGFNFLSRRPRIVNRQPGDLSRLEDEKKRLNIEKAKTQDRRDIRREEFEKARFSMGRNVGELGRIALSQEPDFSQEQRALKQLFGGGDKFWGINNEPVKIFNDLNPRMRGDYETGRLFGF